MAGIEQIVVHSKSYVVRWIKVDGQQSIAWSVEPHKKSINLGIFKHPGGKGGLTSTLPTQGTLEAASNAPETSGSDGAPQGGRRGRQGSIGKNEANVALEKLQSIGLKSVAWVGRCEADKVSMGRYDVKNGEGGMYGLVLDNTFSKNTSKTVHFVLFTHPTDAVPKSGHHLHYSQAVATDGSSMPSKNYSPSLVPISDSSDSLPNTTGAHRTILDDPRPGSNDGVEVKGFDNTSFFTGVLSKKRRKKAQGFAKRFFSLDFTSSTLSYYRDRHSSALRGAVPLSLAAIGANEKTREFSIDSGAEVWHLRALNKKDFEAWRVAFERASKSTVAPSAPSTPAPTLKGSFRPSAFNPAEELEWQRVEQLVSKVSGTRDAVRGLAKDTDPKYAYGTGLGLTQSGGGSTAQSPTVLENSNTYFPTDERDLRRPFWKRSKSTEKSPAALFRRSVSAQLAVPSPTTVALPLSPPPSLPTMQQRPSFASAMTASPPDDVHERCMALLRDLNSVVTDFAALIAESKARRQPPMPTAASRMSLDSIDNQEFFDAEDGLQSPSQLLSLGRDEDATEELHNEHDDADSDISSDAGDTSDNAILASPLKTAQNALFSARPQILPPLPLPAAERRSTVQPPKQLPPSIIGFLRKNAGKDLSTVSMPVTANEPTSFLQRLAESLEYSQLLDSAALNSLAPAERLMYVSAFAISYLAMSRVKERAIRKPFNPMLGETYELVREDLGFRFLAEKVSHHPVRMACQAESLTNGGWTFAQSPRPDQKFWGKSVELNTDGKARIILHEPKEHYHWTQPTCFLRNVIAGEKYVEPVQSMTVSCETTGMTAVVTFKSGGMFSGRSEEVTVQLFDHATGHAPLSLGLTGKWTESLKRTDTGATVWTVGSLVPEAPKVYGFTTFAATLNQITEIEQGHLPPTDSRLRPDQQALEQGDVDKAEALKARLEERQRARRRVLESHGQVYKPEFFQKIDTAGEEEIWVMKEGGGYWDRRQKANWSGLPGVFEV